MPPPFQREENIKHAIPQREKILNISGSKILTLPVLLNTNTAERRDVLGCTMYIPDDKTSLLFSQIQYLSKSTKITTNIDNEGNFEGRQGKY